MNEGSKRSLDDLKFILTNLNKKLNLAKNKPFNLNLFNRFSAVGGKKALDI
jgi:hypothetical protein